VTEHLQTNDSPNIQTYALCTFTFSLQTFTIFFLINAFINVYYNFFDVYHIYASALSCPQTLSSDAKPLLLSVSDACTAVLSSAALDLITWCVQLQRWVQAFRSSWFHVRVMTNNGVERQHRALKYDYLLSYRNSTLSGLVTVLVERFHPDAYRKYVATFLHYPMLFMNNHCPKLGYVFAYYLQFTITTICMVADVYSADSVTLKY